MPVKTATRPRKRGQVPFPHGEVWKSGEPQTEKVPDPFSAHVKPMLAQPGTSLPNPVSQWAFEYKWDGLRALCYWADGHMRLESRTQRDITGLYPDLIAAPEQIGASGLILDGEIISLDESGLPSFGNLQLRMNLSPAAARSRKLKVPVYYYVFDLLWHDGRSYFNEPYHRRRQLLESLSLSHPRWRVPPSHMGAGEEMLHVARTWGLEGLIAKRPQSVYQPGRRSSDWVKVKISQRQEFVIGGWEPREERDDQIGSLLVGYYTPGHKGLSLAGRVGTGFDIATHGRLLELLRPLVRQNSPFRQRVSGKNARFVAPKLVAEVDYRRWPRGGSIQQASFKGLRDDKPPRDVILERD